MTALPKKEPYQKAKICTLHTRLRYNKYWSCHLLFSQHAKLTLAYLITKGILLYVLDVCGKHESTICWILPDGSGNLYINVNKCQILCCAFCDEILPATLWDFKILYRLLWAFESTILIKICSIKCWKSCYYTYQITLITERVTFKRLRQMSSELFLDLWLLCLSLQHFRVLSAWKNGEAELNRKLDFSFSG